MRGLIVDKLHPVVEEILGKHMSLDYKIFVSKEELVQVIGKYEVLIMRVDPVINRNILDHASKLLVIGVGSAGLNHIDMEYARTKGIRIVNAPAMNAESVAELTMGRIIDLMRHVPQANYNLKKKGIWDKYRYLGHELQGKTLGLVALGRIGARVAELASAFGMNILAFDPFLSHEQVAERGAKPVTLEELFCQSDVISLHAPLTEATRHMINRDALSKMKQGSYLLNMARGELVDEEALYEALKEGKLAGAGGDVMEKEPCTISPLYELDNFIITPHIGAQTEEAQYRAGKHMSERVLKALGMLN
ncbi:MAG: D-2-hydroxyacid dehydrogenase [bacterium]|jgi:D-3-phosphoglycerate dehydrogenase